MVLTTWGHSEKTAVCKPGRGPSLGTELASTLILAFPTSKTVRNKSLLFKPARLWHFVQQPELLKQASSEASYATLLCHSGTLQ